VGHIPLAQGGGGTSLLLPPACAANVDSSIFKRAAPHDGHATLSPERLTSFSNFDPQSSQRYS
jgi:hypothetical protein